MNEPTTAELVEFLSTCADDACGMELSDRVIMQQAAARLEAAEQQLWDARKVLADDKDGCQCGWCGITEPIDETYLCTWCLFQAILNRSEDDGRI